MSRPLPDHCEYSVRGVNCGRSAVFLRESDGERQTVLLFEPHSQRFIGPCHWLIADSIAGSLFRESRVRWPGFPAGYVLYEPTPEEEKALTDEQKRFRHALTYEPPPRRGGLVRQDNSGLVDPGRGW